MNKNALVRTQVLKSFLILHDVSFTLAQVGPNGQMDSIELKLPEKAIPGSVGAVVYVTGKMHMD